VNWRKYHRIISIMVALPFFIVLISGLLLQVRQQVEFIQPKALSASKIEGKSLLTVSEIIQFAGVRAEEIDQIIFKPGKFQLSLRLKSNEEIQLHPQTGDILKRAPRLTNFLIEIHQGSYFTEWGQYLVFLPSALGLLFLLISGLVLYQRRKRHE
jgi:uncharacterized iron-regulated membrane protein